MKKKFLALFLALTMVFLLCGCNALDQLRDQRAEYDGGKILYKGVTYQLLPDCDQLQPKLSPKRIYAVTPDVPLLLIASKSHEYLYLSEDGNFLATDYGKHIVYCREDMHQQLSQTIKDGWEYTRVYYNYDVFDEDYNYEERTYELTQEQIEALEFLTNNVEPQTLGQGMSLTRDWYIFLYQCSEDGLFSRRSGQIAGAGSAYYLILDDTDGQVAFQVPEGMVSIFDDITEAYFNDYDALEYDEFA